MLVGAGALDSPLEVTRFEFTIKSCRCTKTCEGVGTSNFCKAESLRWVFHYFIGILFFSTSVDNLLLI